MYRWTWLFPFTEINLHTYITQYVYEHVRPDLRAYIHNVGDHTLNCDELAHSFGCTAYDTLL